MVRKNTCIFLILGIVILVSCSKRESDILVQVEDRRLAKDIFLERFTRTQMFHQKPSFNAEEIKQFIDASFVTDMLLALEAEKSGLDKDPEIVAELGEEKRHLLIKPNGALYNHIITDQLDISEEELKEYYKISNKRIKIAQIMVSSQELADSLYQALQEGADFSTLASSFSIDIGSKDRGGVVNQFYSPGMMNEAFEQAVFKLKPNQISSPIKTGNGYLIIKLISSHEAKQQPYEKEKSILERKLSSKKIRDFTDVYFNELFRRFRLSVQEEGAKKVIEAYRKSPQNTRPPKISLDLVAESDRKLPVIVFEGGGWNVAEFINRYNESGYINHIPLRRISDILNFAHREGIKDILELEAIRLKLDQTREFRQQMEAARITTLAREYRHRNIYQQISISPEDVEQFYQQHKSEMKDQTLDQLRPQIERELQRQKADEKLASMLESIRPKYTIRYFDPAIEKLTAELNESKNVK